MKTLLTDRQFGSSISPTANLIQLNQSENKVCKYCDGLDNTKKAENLYFQCGPISNMKKENFSVGKELLK